MQGSPRKHILSSKGAQRCVLALVRVGVRPPHALVGTTGLGAATAP